MSVSVVEDGGQVHVSVRDDGHRLDTSATTAGFGLGGMRERIELLSAELSLVSASGEGTTVTAVVPAVRSNGAEAHSPPRTLASGS